MNDLKKIQNSTNDNDLKKSIANKLDCINNNKDVLK